MEKIRLSKSCLGPEEHEAVGRVLTAEYLGMGEETRLFEDELRTFLGGEREVICVNTGTSALHIALACLDLRPGDEVLVPTITYVASFQAVSATGAKPIACDVREKDAFIDLRDAERRLTARTRAIMPVHYASGYAGIAEVREFAANHKLRVVEDAAHSFGSWRDGSRIGSDGDIVCFSFDGIKNITAGEGGAVVTGDQNLAGRIRDARLLGVERDTEARYQKNRSWDFDVQHQGFRYHMSNINAAIARAQLGKLEGFSAARSAAAKRYVERLRNLPHLALLDIDYNVVVPHIFPVRISSERRGAVRQALAEQNIEWGLHYKPNHQLSLYRNYDLQLPVGDRLGEELLTLPLHPDLTADMLDRVIDTVIRSISS